MKSLLRVALVAALVLGAVCGAGAQTETTLIAPGGIRAPLDELVPRYEKKTGQKVKATFGSGGGTRKQVLSGEAFDVPVIQLPDADVLASGQVVAGSATPLASVAVGVAVAHGAPKPDISTPEALKATLLAAKAISYPHGAAGAASALSVDDTLNKLGIMDQMLPKIKPGGTGAVVKGDVDFALAFQSEINDPGVDIIGPLPSAVSTPYPMVGVIGAHAKNPSMAKALLDYLSTPAAKAVYKSKGMIPAS